MSLTTLDKYLRRGSSPAQPEQPMATVVRHILATIADTLPTEETQLRLNAERLRDSLNGPIDPQTSASLIQTITETFDKAWESERNLSDALARQELQRILATLNEAMTMAMSGSDRAISRLEHVKDNLDRAAKVKDFQAIRGEIHALTRMVEQEAEKEKAEKERAVTELGPQYAAIRSVADQYATAVNSRPAALQDFEARVASGQRHFCLILVLERMRLVTARYGPAIVEEIIEGLTRKRLRLLPAASEAYRWNDDTLIVFLERDTDTAAVTKQVASLADTVYEHQAFLGNRVATLQVNLRWVVLPVRSDSAAFVTETDRFAQGISSR
jgi:hypothetical protein